jgi:hypothetical protein
MAITGEILIRCLQMRLDFPLYNFMGRSNFAKLEQLDAGDGKLIYRSPSSKNSIADCIERSLNKKFNCKLAIDLL